MRAVLPLSAAALVASALIAPVLGAAAPAGAAGPHPGGSHAVTHVTHVAPVLGPARHGGPVIVWLTDQHKDLDLRTQFALRKRLSYAEQAPVIASIRAAGGTHVRHLLSLNAVAAHVSQAEVTRLSHLPGVAKIIADPLIPIGDPITAHPSTHAHFVADPAAPKAARAPRSVSAGTNPFPSVNDCGTKDKPLIEPFEPQWIGAPGMTDKGLATEPGYGTVVANGGIEDPALGDLVGNPNFVRPAADGGGTVFDDTIPGDTMDSSDAEYYGDASSIAAQGTVEYQYSKELPYAGLPDTCYFVIEGDAPGASLIDSTLTGNPLGAASGHAVPAGQGATAHSSTTHPAHPGEMRVSRAIAGTDAAVAAKADVINESYGFSNEPGMYAAFYASNDAAVAAGTTVVVSSGDSGPQGTVSSPATDPEVIAAGATNTLRENAMAYGFTGWKDNDITPLSSGGTSPNNKLVDLVAPGYGGEAACNPNGSDCPTNTQTGAFGGTSEAAPIIAGAAADVISAYEASHGGTAPTPAMVKMFLTGTATDVDAPADLQGAGLVDVTAAMDAAQQYTGTTVTTADPTPSVLPTPTQLDLSGDASTTSNQSVSLYNASTTPTTVTGTYRELGPETQIGSVVTQDISAPDPSLPIPSDGAQASPPVTFTMPSGVDRLDATMIWPDATNNSILNFELFDPQGRLRQVSYDYGTGSGSGETPTPDIQRVQVADPEPGKWTAVFKWGNGRSHLQDPPNTPGTYTGPMSFRVTGQDFVTSPASKAVTIPAHSSASVPLSVALPRSPGDHPESVQFTDAGGHLLGSLPIARRTLVPSYGGEFDTQITNTVSRGLGQITTFDVAVPAGASDLHVAVKTPDTSADDPFTLYLIDPQGDPVEANPTGSAPTSQSSALTVQKVDGTSMQTTDIDIANPTSGTWEIDVQLDLQTSGKEFEQTVTGSVIAAAPVISSPASGSTASSQTPTVSGTGAPDHTVTVVDGSGATVCTGTVTAAGTWSCTATTQPQGTETLTATQADGSGFASPVSNSVTVTIPAPSTTTPPTATSVTLSADPAAPTVDEPVTLTASTTGVPDGTTVTFYDGSTILGTGTVSGNVATLTLPGGFGPGEHQLTASVPATSTTLASTSAPLDIDVSSGSSTSSIAIKLARASAPYGTPVEGGVAVSGAAPGSSASVTYGSSTRTVPLDGQGVGHFELPARFGVGTHTVTARYAGADGVSGSGPVSTSLRVVKAYSATSLRVVGRRVRPGRRAEVAVSLAGHTGAAYPAGRVQVVAVEGPGRKRVRTYAFREAQHGHATFFVPVPRRRGVVRLTATYRGNPSFRASHSRSARIRVR